MYYIYIHVWTIANNDSMIHPLFCIAHYCDTMVLNKLQVHFSDYLSVHLVASLCRVPFCGTVCSCSARGASIAKASWLTLDRHRDALAYTFECLSRLAFIKLFQQRTRRFCYSWHTVNYCLMTFAMFACRQTAKPYTVLWATTLSATRLTH